jgi:hypothetical protein
MIGDTADLLNSFGNTAAAHRVSPLNTLVDSFQPVATLQRYGQGGSVTNTAPTTLQTKPAIAPVRKPVVRPSIPSSTIVPTPSTPTPEAGSDIWADLERQLAGVDESFSTAKYDAASEAAMGNIITMSEQSANTAAAQYAARARQSGGSAEGAGLIKAQALVTGRRTAEDVRLQKEQYDIAQKEAARQLSAEIAAHIDSLRMDYLRNLTQKQIAELQSKTSLDVAGIEAGWHKDIAAGQLGLGYAQLGEQSREFDFSHGVNAPWKPWSGTTDMAGYFTGYDQFGKYHSHEKA